MPSPKYIYIAMAYLLTHGTIQKVGNKESVDSVLSPRCVHPKKAKVNQI